MSARVVFFILLISAQAAYGTVQSVTPLDGDVGGESQPNAPVGDPAPTGGGNQPSGAANSGGSNNGNSSNGNRGTQNPTNAGATNGTGNGTPPAPDPCIARVQSAASQCQSSYSSALSSCDGNNAEFTALRQEGTQLQQNMAGEANINRVNASTENYQSKYANALGNYTAACSSAATSCESACKPPATVSSCPSMSEAIRNMESRGRTCSTTLQDKVDAAQRENQYVQNTIADSQRNQALSDGGKTGGPKSQTANESTGGSSAGPVAREARLPIAIDGSVGGESGMLYDTSSGSLSSAPDPNLPSVSPAGKASDANVESARRAREAALKAAGSDSGAGGSRRKPASWFGRAMSSIFGGSFGLGDGDSAARTAGLVSQNGSPEIPDLRQFLPGAARDPQAVGAAGLQAEGIQSSNVNIFERIHIRYESLNPTFFQE